MKVKDLIIELLDCNMNDDVTVLVELNKEEFERLYSPTTYPIDDDFDINYVRQYDHFVMIELEEKN